MSNRDGNTGDLHRQPRRLRNLRRITNHPMADATPTWSPTGTQIAFTSDRGGAPQVYIVNVDGTGLNASAPSRYCDRATWSPAPLNEIAYTSQSGGGYEIRIFDFATGDTRTITDGIGSNESPAFAPNGRHIAFVSDRSGRQQVYTIARDGTRPPADHQGRQATSYPNWSQ